MTEPDETMLARGHSRVLNAIHDAEAAAATESPAEPCLSFKDIMTSRSSDRPAAGEGDRHPTVRAR